MYSGFNMQTQITSCTSKKNKNKYSLLLYKKCFVKEIQHLGQQIFQVLLLINL